MRQGQDQGKRYDLPHVLLYSVLAVASGATSYRKIEQFLQAHWQQLNEAFGSRWKRAPAYTGLRKILQGLDAAELEAALRRLASEQVEHTTAPVGRAVIALDGKTLRGSLARFEDRRAAQVLSALAVQEQVVLGHVLIEDGSKDHEIAAAQRLIAELGLSDCLYTLDALHLQNTVERIVGLGSDALIQLKGNQPRLLARLREQVRRRPAHDEHYSATLGRRNRIEQRRVRVWPLAAGSGLEPWHDHFQCLVEVTRTTEIFDTARKTFVPRAEQPALYLCTRRAGAEELAQAIRGHWAIENQLHHVLDTALAEDACRIRRNPGVFAGLRHLALNLLRSNGQTNISQALYRNALCLDLLLNYAGVREQ